MKKAKRKIVRAYPKTVISTKDILSKVSIALAIFCLGVSTILSVVNTLSVNKINNKMLELRVDGQIDLINVYRLLEQKLDKLAVSVVQNSEKLEEKINAVPQNEKIKKMLLEEKLKQVNVVIMNETAGAQGSGVSIKYKNEYYVLSAGHMADNMTDKLALYENDKKICDLEIVKHEYTPEDNSKNSHDLILLRPHDRSIVPRYYVELNEFEVPVGTNLYVVGNPLGFEDVISDGRVVTYSGNFIYYIDHTYFGNSGGGIYTTDGKLLGIVSHMINLQPVVGVPPYTVNGAVNLKTIQKFMETL